MRTVGIILKESRLSKKLSLDQVEQATKIRKKFLVDIENDQYDNLPSVAYAKGFIKNYSNFLGLNTNNVMAFFRRQTTEVPKSSLLPKGMSEPLNATFFRLTPNRFITLTIAILVTTFLLYFGLQYQRLQIPPALTLDSPKESSVINDRRVDILGSTDPDATVTINGVNVLIHTDGKFFDQVALNPGENTIVIVATSRLGKSITVTRKVISQIQ
jgi:cytoskeletal protein RodZ